MYNKEYLKLKEKNRKHLISDFGKMNMEERQIAIRNVIDGIVWDGKNIIIS